MMLYRCVIDVFDVVIYDIWDSKVFFLSYSNREQNCLFSLRQSNVSSLSRYEARYLVVCATILCILISATFVNLYCKREGAQ